ncbi:MAG: SIR2 family protein [Reichenbachiella sp.]|uniref:SIR2 family protein n=1 Tax=Reichenbachiella sp. TaxID=2184521 RepID=UPI003296E0B8
MELPKEIVKAIENNDLVIFAGAGLSMKFGLPDWRNLVKDIIQNSGKKEFVPFLEILDNGTMSPVDVLEVIKDEHNEVKRYINKNFHVENGDLKLHKNLLELSGQIITTNYDDAFELAAEGKINSTISTSTFNISEINKSKNPYIFNLHGSYREADNCVIFNKDYAKLYKEDNATISKLKSIFSEKTILFIGFGFKDLDLKRLFSHLDRIFSNNNRHFVICKDANPFLSYEYLEPILVADYEKELNVFIKECIEIKEKHNSYNGDVLQDAEPKVAKIAILHPNPLDIKIQNELLRLVSCFDTLEANIFYGFLNAKTLSSIEEFDLLIIATKIFKSKLYIEDDYLKSSLVSQEELLDFIPNDLIPVVFITDKEIPPIVGKNAVYISTIKPNIVNKFIFKGLNQKQLNFFEKEINVNLDKLLDEKIFKGKSNKFSIYGNNRSLTFGKRSPVIGRVEEQSVIASKLIAINKTNKLLNIKASGGVGKTTLIKKVANELYNRGYFCGGVEFISCENVKSYQDFEELIIHGFKLNNIINFKEYLRENYVFDKIDSLIILDNFETVANAVGELEFCEVLELLKFSIDYTNIVITSRERISSVDDFEDVYSLTPLITDDALQLFEKDYGKVDKLNEVKVLREDILEELLNNNPLAIKLVTNSRPRFRHIDELKTQLKNHFFESTNIDYSSAFNNNADLNIERSKSIYQSINYSYTTLKHNEKIAFELLNLFPDGISLSNFKKCFSSRNSSNNHLTDKDLRVLRDKSLVEDYNGTLQLQPIIRRFAMQRFSERNEELKIDYCIDAYTFNCFVLDVIEAIEKKKSFSEAMRFYSSYKNNLLNVLSYVSDIKFPEGKEEKKKYILNYIYKVDDYIHGEKQINEFQEGLEIVSSYFSEIPNSQLLIKTLKYNKSYFHHEFDEPYKVLEKLLPVDKIIERNFEEEDYSERRYKNIISNLHSMEGHTLNLIISQIKNWNFDRFLDNHFFYLGIIENISRKKNGFYYFEYELMFNQLEVEKLEEYIDTLFMDEHLEKMQCTYTLSKVKKIDKKNIQKLVVTNPYTQGLKQLMFAFESNIPEDKIKYYQSALKNLGHIKYYYLEALYYYCKFIVNLRPQEYEALLEEAVLLCEKYKYQYLLFLFNHIDCKDIVSYEYYSDFYNLEKLEEYVIKHNNIWVERYKEYEDLM